MVAQCRLLCGSDFFGGIIIFHNQTQPLLGIGLPKFDLTAPITPGHAGNAGGGLVLYATGGEPHITSEH